MDSIIIDISSLSDTKLLAEIISKHISKCDVVFLKGDLGSGKTTFTRYFIRSLINNEELDVISPTFSIVNIYESKCFPIYHCDLYRVESLPEIYELGIEEGMKYGITIIEWPDIIEKVIRNVQVTIYFICNPLDNTRKAEIFMDSNFFQKQMLLKALSNEFKI